MKSVFGLTLAKRNLAGFFIVASLIAVTGISSVTSMRKLIASFNEVSHSFEVTNDIQKMSSSLMAAQIYQRNYLLTDDPFFLRLYRESVETFPKLLAEIKILTIDNTDQQTRLEELEPLLIHRLEFMNEMLSMYPGKDLAPIRQILSVAIKKEDKQIEYILRELIEEENRLLKTRSDRSEVIAHVASVIAALGGTLAFFLTFLGVYFILRDTHLREASEERFRNLFENAPIGMGVATLEGTWVKANAKLSEIWGYTEADMTGKSFDEIAHPEDRQILVDYREKLVSGKLDFVSLEIRYVHKSGRTIWVLLSGSVLRDPSGIPLRLLTQIQDITEKKTNENSLKETTKTLSLLIHSSPVGIIAFDLDHNLRLWNPACERIFGWSEDEVLGGPLPFVAEDQREESSRLIESMRQSRQKLEFDVDRTRKDGSTIRVSVATLPLFDERKEIYAYMATIIDVSKQWKTEAELRKAREEALQAAKVKSEFLANMSHEIRTPLNGIIGMTDLLLETKLDEQQERYAQIVQDSGSGLLTIINDILDFSKIEAGKLNLEIIDFNPVAIVENQVELLSFRAKQKSLSISSFIDPRIPVLVKGDPGRLSQVLLNLIGNSIKFTWSGEITVRADLINQTATSSQVRFSVSDSGIGMSKAVVTQLFKPFMQADGSTARKFGGTGLGLSICKQLVELMGGNILVESEEGKGSRFFFALNLKHTQEIQRNDPIEQSLSPRMRALILDKELAAGEMVSQYLQNWNFRTWCVASSELALKVLRDEAGAGDPFNWVIVDEKADTSIAEAIQNDKTLGEPRSILLVDKKTGNTEIASTRFSIRLTKPLRQSDLHDAIFDEFSQRMLEQTNNVIPLGIPPGHQATDSSAGRILVVEDNSVNQMLALMILKKLGYSAHAVANGKEAVEAYEKASFDLILMDCQMPEMDGYEATRQIREWEKKLGSARVPIIALTANAMKEDQEKCMQSGMDDYLAKPIKKEQIANIVERWLKAPKELKQVA